MCVYIHTLYYYYYGTLLLVPSKLDINDKLSLRTSGSRGRRQRGTERLHFATLFTTKKRVNLQQILIMSPKKTPVTEESQDIKKLLDFTQEEVRAMKILHGQILNVLEEVSQVEALKDQNVNRI